eukprot:99615-Prorocentrum_minimum.AAC.1
MLKGRLEAHRKRQVCQRRFEATPKRLDKLYATPEDLNNAWFAPLPSNQPSVTAPSNILILQEDDEREWPPNDPSLWKITEL